MTSSRKKDRGPGICFVSDQDVGGAAIACRRIREAVISVSGIQAPWLVCRGGRNAEARDAGMWPAYGPFLRYETMKRMTRNEERLRAEHCRYSERNTLDWLHRLNPDVIALFNLHDEASFRLIERIRGDVPLVISLQDMWYLTGYCYYSMDCRKYVTGCKGECPQMGRCGAAVRMPAAEWARRQAFWLKNKDRIHIVAPSEWMAGCASERFQGNLPVSVIPNCVDTTVFRPLGDKTKVREFLGVPVEGLIILSGAVSVHDPRKGSSYLLEAVRQVKTQVKQPVNLVVFGEKGAADMPEGTVCTGPVHDEDLLNLYYNAADVFVLPSLAESFGLVYVEAMAAGIPSVAFDVTGCRDTVKDGVTGFRASPRNAEHLAECIKKVLLLRSDEQDHMSRLCREVSEREFSFAQVGEAYRKIFKG
jgi:glycosyltransferase involved in cell wall biosynthesis